MTPDETDMGRIREAFALRFSHFNLCLPDEHVRERRKGSLPYGSGRLYYVFGREEEREYLEYYACHRMGDAHERIYQDGTVVDLPELSSLFGYDPDTPGDFEEKAAIMEKEYRETLEDLVAKGLFDDEPVPNSLPVNSHLVLRGNDADGRDRSE